MAQETFFMKQGDTQPDLQVTLKDGDGAAADVTGATVKFSMRAEGRTAKVISEAAVTIVTAASGVVKYVWAAADTKGAGRFLGEFEVTYSGGGIETFPNSEDNRLVIIISPEIA